MTMRHCGEGSALWYRAFRYRWLERQIATRLGVQRILDLGCGGGENMWRFIEWERTPFGLDVSRQRLERARVHGPIVQGEGTCLPFADDSLDMIYVAHLLHHVSAPQALLSQAHRCLRPEGFLFLVDTVEDHPLVRLGRDLYPWWRGDAVETRFRFAQLVDAVQEAGFDILDAGQYSVLFWIWEILPERFPWLDWMTPFFTALEVSLGVVAGRWAAHGYCVGAAI